MKRKHFAVYENDHEKWKAMSRKIGIPVYFLLRYVIENDFDEIFVKTIQEAWKEQKKIRKESWGEYNG